ncbi:MAG: integration host factor subunit beta [Candidatus Coatesbacteria bacterium]|jgi:nucleoid DNA-binding protein|nr:integration host factor subunit beta [Candidatus Coatesbacteria bacterium]
MTKADLAQKISKSTGLTLKQTTELINAILETLIECLTTPGDEETLKKQRVEIRGFGTFRLRHKRARQARNPRTGEIIEVKEKWVPHFKPSKKLKSMLPDG